MKRRNRSRGFLRATALDRERLPRRLQRRETARHDGLIARSQPSWLEGSAELPFGPGNSGHDAASLEPLHRGGVDEVDGTDLDHDPTDRPHPRPAARAAMDKAVRTEARPPWTARRPRFALLSRLRGAAPTRETRADGGPSCRARAARRAGRVRSSRRRRAPKSAGPRQPAKPGSPGRPRQAPAPSRPACCAATRCEPR